MKIKWRDMYNDFKTVIVKHLRLPEPESIVPEAQLIQMIQLVQKQQKSVNELRDRLVPLVDGMKNEEVFREFDRLATMAPTKSDDNRRDNDGCDDPMFS
jgi:hypothetical protein